MSERTPFERLCCWWGHDWVIDGGRRWDQNKCERCGYAYATLESSTEAT